MTRFPSPSRGRRDACPAPILRLSCSSSSFSFLLATLLARARGRTNSSERCRVSEVQKRDVYAEGRPRPSPPRPHPLPTLGSLANLLSAGTTAPTSPPVLSLYLDSSFFLLLFFTAVSLISCRNFHPVNPI